MRFDVHFDHGGLDPVLAEDAIDHLTDGSVADDHGTMRGRACLVMDGRGIGFGRRLAVEQAPQPGVALHESLQRAERTIEHRVQHDRDDGGGDHGIHGAVGESAGLTAEGGEEKENSPI